MYSRYREKRIETERKKMTRRKKGRHIDRLIGPEKKKNKT